MNPIISWILFLFLLSGAYICVNGIPQFARKQRESNNVISEQEIKRSAKRKKKATGTKSHDVKESIEVAKEYLESLGNDVSSKLEQVAPEVLEEAKRVVKGVSSGIVKKIDSNGTARVEQGSKSSLTQTRDAGIRQIPDPVETVMNGKSRTTATAIGRPSENRADHLASVKLKEQQEAAADVTDDMVNDRAFAARTLRISSPNSPSPFQQRSAVHNRTTAMKTDGEEMSKKQKQNAAKKAKLKAAKELQEVERQVALRKHTRAIETRRMEEMIQSERKNKANNHTSAPASAWDQDWKVVPKSKKAVSNGQTASVDSNGKLIWE